MSEPTVSDTDRIYDIVLDALEAGTSSFDIMDAVKEAIFDYRFSNRDVAKGEDKK